MLHKQAVSKMEIIYEPFVGKTTTTELYITKVYAKADESEYGLLLEKGFLPYESVSSITDITWIPSRSVRVKVQDYVPNKKQKKLLKTGVTFEVRKMDRAICEPIFIEYLKRKNFFQIENYSTELFLCEDYDTIYYSYQNKVVAFLVFRKLKDAMVSFQFATENFDNRLSLGILSKVTEIEIAKSLGFEYLYIGAGYESCCKYKSSFIGFEFWDGTKWSNNKEGYSELCERDDTITTLDDLSKLFETNF